MRAKFFRLLAKFSIFITMWTVILGSPAAQAAELNYLRTAMTRIQASVSGDHTITFQLPTIIAAGAQLDLDFTTSTAGQTNFTFVAGASTTRDIDITTSTASGSGMNAGVDTCTGTYADRNPVTTTSTSANAQNWGFTSSALSGGFRITLDQPNTLQLIPASTCVRIRIGSNTSGTSPVSLLTNPGSTTNTSTQLRLAISNTNDSGGSSFSIISDDQPAANATNTPSLQAEYDVAANTSLCSSTSIGSNGVGTVNFYDLRADGVVNARQILCTRITSDAVGGVTVQIRSNLGQMTSTRINPVGGGAIVFPATAQTGSGASTTLNIANLTLGINTSTEAYGFCVDDSSGSGAGTSQGGTTTLNFPTGINDGTCTNNTTDGLQTNAQHFRTLTNSLQPVWTTGAPVFRAFTNIVFKAAATVTTPADNAYTDTLTVVAYATF